MAAPPAGPSVRNVLVIAIVVSALVGATAGFLAGFVSSPQPAPQVREFWVFTVVLPFNDSTPGFPSHDYFAPDRIVVNRGDTVKIHFFNTEDVPEDHTFTMDAPYAMNRVLLNCQTTDFEFVASTAGLFPYRCTLHQPTMTGTLVVLG